MPSRVRDFEEYLTDWSSGPENSHLAQTDLRGRLTLPMSQRTHNSLASVLPTPPMKRTKISLNSRFDQMVKRVALTLPRSSVPPSDSSSAIGQPHNRSSSGSSSFAGSSDVRLRTPADAYSDPPGERIGGGFPVFKLQSNDDGDQASRDPLPDWLSETLSSLGPDHPLRNLVPDVGDAQTLRTKHEHQPSDIQEERNQQDEDSVFTYAMPHLESPAQTGPFSPTKTVSRFSGGPAGANLTNAEMERHVSPLELKDPPCHPSDTFLGNLPILDGVLSTVEMPSPLPYSTPGPVSSSALGPLPSWTPYIDATAQSFGARPPSPFPTSQSQSLATRPVSPSATSLSAHLVHEYAPTPQVMLDHVSITPGRLRSSLSFRRRSGTADILRSSYPSGQPHAESLSPLGPHSSNLPSHFGIPRMDRTSPLNQLSVARFALRSYEEYADPASPASFKLFANPGPAYQAQRQPLHSSPSTNYSSAGYRSSVDQGHGQRPSSSSDPLESGIDVSELDFHWQPHVRSGSGVREEFDPHADEMTFETGNYADSSTGEPRAPSGYQVSPAIGRTQYASSLWEAGSRDESSPFLEDLPFAYDDDGPSGGGGAPFAYDLFAPRTPDRTQGNPFAYSLAYMTQMETSSPLIDAVNSTTTRVKPSMVPLQSQSKGRPSALDDMTLFDDVDESAEATPQATQSLPDVPGAPFAPAPGVFISPLSKHKATASTESQGQARSATNVRRLDRRSHVGGGATDMSHVLPMIGRAPSGGEEGVIGVVGMAEGTMVHGAEQHALSQESVDSIESWTDA